VIANRRRGLQEGRSALQPLGSRNRPWRPPHRRSNPRDSLDLRKLG